MISHPVMVKGLKKVPFKKALVKGETNDETLQNLGYSPSEIAELKTLNIYK